MRTEAVRAQLAARGLGDRYREFTVSSATVALAAEALHCEAGRIAKTLSILTATGPVLVVTMGLARLDNRKFKDLFHEKARFIPVEDVERLTGHPQGGVCPFALPEGVRVFLDESLRRYDVVYPAAGAPNNAVQLTPDELAAVRRAMGRPLQAPGRAGLTGPIPWAGQKKPAAACRQQKRASIREGWAPFSSAYRRAATARTARSGHAAELPGPSNLRLPAEAARLRRW